MESGDLYLRQALVRVDFELLAEALRLPEGSEILSVRETAEFERLELRVASPEFPVVKPGMVLVRRNVQVTIHYGTDPHRFESRWSG
jgi:hypothetical protein